MKKYVILIGVLVLVVIAAFWAIGVQKAKAPGERACTLEAKICLDGSAVGRTGPDCAFAPCPDEVATSTDGGSGGGSILPYKSGVRGNVSLGPTCPVERIPSDPACVDKPYATAIVVYRAGSKSPFILGNSDTNGVFEFSLPPGSYTLSAVGGTTLPRCAPANVTVGPDSYVSATISCDTGIR